MKRKRLAAAPPFWIHEWPRGTSCRAILCEGLTLNVSWMPADPFKESSKPGFNIWIFGVRQPEVFKTLEGGQRVALKRASRLLKEARTSLQRGKDEDL